MSHWVHQEGMGLGRGMSKRDLDEIFASLQKKDADNEKLETRLMVLAKMLGYPAKFSYRENPERGTRMNAPFQIKVFEIGDNCIPCYDLPRIVEFLLKDIEEELKPYFLDFLVESKGFIIKHPYKEGLIPAYALAVWVGKFLFICNSKKVHFPLEWEITVDYTNGSKNEYETEACFSDWVLQVSN